MNDIKVSIILIVYNHEKYIQQAIESILMQEVDFTYEIIVCDDKSTDHSREMLHEYKDKFSDRIVLLFHKNNVGATKNVYSGFMKARGEYITCLEGDDYWNDPKKLQKQVDFLENNRDYLGVSHVIEARDMKGNYISRYPTLATRLDQEVTVETFLRGHYFSAVATVFRNIFLDKSTDFSIYYKAHRFVGDFTLCILLLDKGRIKVLDEVMSVYRLRRESGEGNYNSIRNTLEQYDDHIKLLNAVNKHFKGKYDFSKEYINRSTGILIYILRQLQEFYKSFCKIPDQIKMKFWIMLPVNMMRIVLRKYITFKKNRISGD